MDDNIIHTSRFFSAISVSALVGFLLCYVYEPRYALNDGEAWVVLMIKNGDVMFRKKNYFEFIFQTQRWWWCCDDLGKKIMLRFFSDTDESSNRVSHSVIRGTQKCQSWRVRYICIWIPIQSRVVSNEFFFKLK